MTLTLCVSVVTRKNNRDAKVIDVGIEELRTALLARGLQVAALPDGRLQVYRGGLALLAETLTFRDGRPCWSWGAPIDRGDVEGVAALVDHVVSRPASVVRNSA